MDIETAGGRSAVDGMDVETAASRGAVDGMHIETAAGRGAVEVEMMVQMQMTLPEQ